MRPVLTDYRRRAQATRSGPVTQTAFLHQLFTWHQPTPTGCTCQRPGMTATWPTHMAALIGTVITNQLITHEAQQSPAAHS